MLGYVVEDRVSVGVLLFGFFSFWGTLVAVWLHGGL